MLAPASASVTTVRGFLPGTPSGDDDPDYTTTPPLCPKDIKPPRRTRKKVVDDVVSANCSPVLKPAASPAMSGIAKLRKELDEFVLINSSRANSITHNGVGHVTETKNSSNRLASRRHKLTLRGCGIESGDETGSECTTTYEVNLESDFFGGGTEDLGGGENMVLGRLDEGLATPRHKITSNDFEPLRCLGKGTFGTVLLVKQRTTGRLYAQKQFKKASLIVHKKLIEQTKTERQILESVNRHPFVVNLYYAFQDQEKLYLILEYGQGGELFTHLSTERMFPEATAAFYMAEMVLALAHLHDNLGVVYRDLKPENCLLDAEGHLLLTDFGLSKVAVDPDSCNSMLGTVEYMAPEIIQGKKYGKAVDWWSFGALGFDLMTGNPPFRGANNAKIQNNIVKQRLALPYFLGPDAKDLLTKLLRKDPAKRLGSHMPEHLATIKKHRFFRKIEWKKLAARKLVPPIQPLITDPEQAENFAPEFTDLSLSPVVSRFDDSAWCKDSKDAKDDPFSGFSYVASSSLLESNFLPQCYMQD